MGEQAGGPRNEYGTGGPVWPNADGHNWRSPRCPRGHLLSVAGTNGEFCHLYRAHQEGIVNLASRRTAPA
jgi:hypothetical protein